LRRQRAQMAVVHGQALRRRDYVHMVALDGYGSDYANDGHLGSRADQLGCAALMIRRQVQNHDECHAVVGGHVLEKLLDGQQASGRSTHPYHGKIQVAGPDTRSLRTIGVGIYRGGHHVVLSWSKAWKSPLSKSINCVIHHDGVPTTSEHLK
jgi:hypothetical protein